jgi:hypothetical protein
MFLDPRFKNKFVENCSIFTARIISWVKDCAEIERTTDENENDIFEEPHAKRPFTFMDSLAEVASSSQNIGDYNFYKSFLLTITHLTIQYSILYFYRIAT